MLRKGRFLGRRRTAPTANSEFAAGAWLAVGRLGHLEAGGAQGVGLRLDVGALSKQLKVMVFEQDLADAMAAAAVVRRVVASAAHDRVEDLELGLAEVDGERDHVK
ncbi:MAG: hypothetical protein OXE40_19520 [Gammaproteobacteria bacterium]|nr:hypothetical protein [Gammaproteobacteria bacterium]